MKLILFSAVFLLAMQSCDDRRVWYEEDFKPLQDQVKELAVKSSEQQAKIDELERRITNLEVGGGY
jgi:peptidoglycan hydrolase CwlO-like protein